MRLEDADTGEPIPATEVRPMLEAVIEGGAVTDLMIRNSGNLPKKTNLRIRVLRRPPLHTFARATVVTKDGKVETFSIQERGGYYASPPFIVLHDLSPEGRGRNLAAEAVLDDQGGIAEIRVRDGGTGYPAGEQILVGIYNRRMGGGTTQISELRRATGKIELATEPGGPLKTVHVTNPGGPYAVAPAVRFSGPGSGARARAEIGASGEVVRVVIQTPGHDFTAASEVLFVDGGESPTGIQIKNSLALGDTRARRLYCEAQGVTRYRSLLEALGLPKASPQAWVSPPQVFAVLASARPPKADVLPFTYSYRWNLSQSERRMGSPGSPPLVIRREGAIRVWLRRPWNVSGEEKLGVVVLNAEENLNTVAGENTQRAIPLKMRSLVSRWGYDPVWDATALPPLYLDDLTNASGFINYEDLSEYSGPDERMVGVALHNVSYDSVVDRWYTDVVIRSPAAGRPIVQLAIVRVQPSAGAGLLLSDVTLCDMIQLPADRELQITRRSSDDFFVELRGAFEKRPNAESMASSGPAPAPAGPVTSTGEPGKPPREWPKRRVVVEVRRAPAGLPSYVRGPLANSSPVAADRPWESTKIPEQFTNPDIFDLTRKASAYAGNVTVRWPASPADTAIFLCVIEAEEFPTSESHRTSTGQSSRISTEALPPVADWKPFTCAVQCSRP